MKREALGRFVFITQSELNKEAFPPQGPRTTTLSLYRPLLTTKFNTLLFLPYSGNLSSSCKFAIVIFYFLSESPSMKDVSAVFDHFSCPLFIVVI